MVNQTNYIKTKLSVKDFNKFKNKLLTKYYHLYQCSIDGDCQKNPEFHILNDIDGWLNPVHINKLEEKVEKRLKKYRKKIIEAVYIDSIKNSNRFEKIKKRVLRFSDKTFNFNPMGQLEEYLKNISQLNNFTQLNKSKFLKEYKNYGYDDADEMSLDLNILLETKYAKSFKLK